MMLEVIMLVKCNLTHMCFCMERYLCFYLDFFFYTVPIKHNISIPEEGLNVLLDL